MDLSLASSVPKIVAFYAVMLLLVFPALALVDRVNAAMRRAKRRSPA
jgi:hypothetical protein